MFDYITKYKNLPQEIRDKLSVVEVMSAINQIEEQFGIDLATIVMKIMVKEIAINDLSSYFVFEYNFDQAKADELTEKIISRVFFGIADYLNIKERVKRPVIKEPIAKEPDPIIIEPEVKKETAKPVESSSSFYFSPEDEEEIRDIAKSISNINTEDVNTKIDDKIKAIIKKTGIVFSASFMSDRFQQIMRTYLRGIRDKIETIQAMTRSFANGGLGLDQSVVDKIMLVVNEASESPRVEENSASSVIQPDVPEKSSDSNSYISIPNTEKAKEPAEKEKFDVLTALKSVGMRDYEYDLAKELEKKKNEQKKLVENEVATVVKPIELQKEIIQEMPVESEEEEDSVEEFIENLDIDHELMPPTPAIIKPSKSQPEIVNLEEVNDSAEEFIENLDIDHELMPPTPAIIQPAKSQSEIKSQSKHNVVNPVKSAPRLNPTRLPQSNLTEQEAIIPPKAESFNETKVISIKPQLVTPDKPRVAPKKEPSVKIEQEPAKKINFIRPVNIEGKVKMEDVKYIPHVLDPVDELRYFNLINFRRLSTDPKIATEKIKEKIELLQKEKYSKGFEAIKAWRESIVSRLYIQMGHECIENQINIDEVIKRRRTAGEEFLEMNEFDAILDLNKSLRY